MTTRQKLEIQINTPTEIELLYDEPVSGKSQYGTYHLYAVAVEGEEYSYFAPEDVHQQIKDLKKGQRFTITKLAAPRAGKVITKYDVKLYDNTEANKIKEDKADSTVGKEDEPLQDFDDGLYEIMLTSYRDAIKITSELGGLADPSRIAITLFIARAKSNGNSNHSY